MCENLDDEEGGVVGEVREAGRTEEMLCLAAAITKLVGG